MTEPRPALGPRQRKGRLFIHVLLVTGLGGALLSFGVVSGFAADASVETAGSLGSYHWNPSTGTVSTNGTVEFKNSESIPHGLVFENAPAAPSCPGVPGVGQANWSGTCTFSQPGTYKFYCPVHPTEMKGTITVTGSTGPAAPVVSTESATAVKDTEATLNGKVNPSGQATEYLFKYGTSTAYDHETTLTSAGSGTLSTPESATVTGLAPSTTYHFQVFAENGTGMTPGADRTFTTAGPPTATTESATGVGGVKATLAANVNPDGLETTYFFKYGLTTSYDQKTAEKSAGAGTANVPKTEPLAGLSPNTTYHFLVVAKNSAGEVEGADRTFTTLGAPHATTGQAGGLSATGATLEGVINPQGQPTTYYFNYGLSSSYEQKTTEVSGGEGIADLGVTAQLTELLPETTYHFQLVAHNASGTTPGADQTFVTGSVLPPPPLPSPPPPKEETSSTPPPETPPPDTRITLKPPAKTKDSTPTIKFTATAAGATYMCSVDNKAFKTCRSPFTAPALKPGGHKIRVKAVVAGTADPTPASCSFKVLPRGGKKS